LVGGASKSRWIALPDAKIEFSASGAWQFPAGTVFVKNSELPTDARDSSVRRRLETRLLVRNSAGGVYDVTYKWRADQSDAELLTGSVTEDNALRDVPGRSSTRAGITRAARIASPAIPRVPAACLASRHVS